MTDQRPERVRALFDQAADLPSAEQKAFLDSCCAGDPDLRARVEYLLACDARLRAGEEATGWLASPLVRAPQQAAAAADDSPSTAEQPGPGSDQAAEEKAAPLPARLGRYQLLEEIGRGGMGAVLRGHDPDLGRDLAVKVLLPGNQDNPALLSRFIEEAQIGGQLQHPGIVPVYEVGRSDDQQPYFTMKLVRGRTLAELLRERSDPRQDLPRHEQIFEQVCQTMAYAHSHGVIHRDLKPANIMVGAFGEVQVMDWGLAKVLTPGQEYPPPNAVWTTRCEGAGGTTQPGWVAGTPAYMAPEQAAGATDRLDQRCDVFGLGAILCEILTGQPPCQGADNAEVFARALRADLAEALTRLDACGADAELIRLARSSLAAQAAARPPNAGILAAQMAAYRESMATRLRQAELAQAEARVKAAEERKRRRLTMGLAAVVLLTVLLAGGAWLWWQRGREGRDRQALEALAQAELLHQQAQAGNDPGKWAEAQALVHRAEALLEEGTGQVEAAARAQALLDALNEAEADRRLLAHVDEIQLVKAKNDLKAFTFGLRGALPEYAAAFKEYGIGPDAVAPAQAAARIGQRPLPVGARIIGALDDWLSVMWLRQSPDDAATTQWVETVLSAADRDPWRKQFRVALRKRDQQELRRLAAEVDVARQPPWTLTLLGMALRGCESLPQALELMRRAQGQYPGDFWVNFELGWQLERDPDRSDDAVRFYRAAVALRPESPLARYTLAAALVNKGEQDRAITVLREAATLKPDMAVVHWTLGHLLSRKKDLDGAIVAYRRAIALEHDFASAYHHLGLRLHERGDRAGLDKVINQVQQLIKRKPNESGAYSALGVLLLRKKDLKGARAAYRQALVTLPPEDFDAHLILGYHLKEELLYDEALVAFRRCEDLAKQTKNSDQLKRAGQVVRETELAIGRAYAGRRQWGEAADYYNRLFQRKEAQGDEVCFERAAVLLLAGDQDGYRKACAHMLERAAREKGFRAYLAARARTLAPISVPDAARPEQLFQQDLKAAPLPSWLLTERAALHYRAGRFARAVPVLEQSLAADKRPGSAVLNQLWLALTCQNLGKTAQAHSCFEAATKWLDQFPEGSPARAEEKLGLHLHNWLEAHVLRREAETALDKH
jgi:serine/threonine-protein kinase